MTPADLVLLYRASDVGPPGADGDPSDGRSGGPLLRPLALRQARPGTQQTRLEYSTCLKRKNNRHSLPWVNLITETEELSGMSSSSFKYNQFFTRSYTGMLKSVLMKLSLLTKNQNVYTILTWIRVSIERTGSSGM